MLVASAAMFFAIASSAFVLRARAIRAHCASHAPTGVVVQPVQAPRAPVDAPACGEPITEINADGTRTVTYTSCSQEPVVIVDGDETAFATPLPDDLILR